jgi:hypothetical protein
MSNFANASVFVPAEVLVLTSLPKSNLVLEFGTVEKLLKNSGFPLLMRDHSAKTPGRDLSHNSRDAVLSGRFLFSDCDEVETGFGVAERLRVDCPLEAMDVVRPSVDDELLTARPSAALEAVSSRPRFLRDCRGLK